MLLPTLNFCCEQLQSVLPTNSPSIATVIRMMLSQSQLRRLLPLSAAAADIDRRSTTVNLGLETAILTKKKEEEEE